jgi:dihydrofolate reductase
MALSDPVRAPEEWANFDDGDTAYAHEELHKYDAFVMGRLTYERFYSNWASLRRMHSTLLTSVPTRDMETLDHIGQPPDQNDNPIEIDTSE